MFSVFEMGNLMWRGECVHGFLVWGYVVDSYVVKIGVAWWVCSLNLSFLRLSQTVIYMKLLL